MTRMHALMAGAAALSFAAIGATAFAEDDKNDKDDHVIWVTGAGSGGRVIELGDGRHEIIVENGAVTIDGEAVETPPGAHVVIDEDAVRVVGGIPEVESRCERRITIAGDDGDERTIVTNGCGDGAHVVRLGNDFEFFDDSPHAFAFDFDVDDLEDLDELEALKNLDHEIEVIIESALADFDGSRRVVIHRDGHVIHLDDEDLTDEERAEIEAAQREAREAGREAREMAREARREAREAAREAHHAARRARAFAFTGPNFHGFEFDDISEDARRLGDATRDWPEGEYALRRDGDDVIATGPDGVERRLADANGLLDLADDDSATMIIERDEE